MRCSKALLLAASAVVLPFFGSQAKGQIRAFGSAEGYGARALGARNGTPTIYHVTNLNATGAGSFVDAISVANRIIVFDVGGVINLSSAPSAKSNLYIAGQTAPGGGITINGYQALGLYGTNNNIVRYLHIRPGSQSPGSDNGIGMGQAPSAILDHVSVEFGKYNNIDAVANSTISPRITIQNSIIANPISNGTSNRGQGFNGHLEGGYYTLTKNLWVSGHSRNPLAKMNDQFINNIEYNNEIGYLTSGTSGVFDHDLVNNAFIFGPASTSSADFGQLSTPDTFYSSGNVQDTNKDGVWNATSTNPSTVNPLSATPLHPTTASLPTMSVTDAYNYVLAHSGASLTHDDLDNLVLGQVQTLGAGVAGYTAGTAGPAVTDVPLDVESPFAGHTGLYHKSSDTGLSNNGLGTIATASRPAGFDTDNDGVADAWEATHGMNSANAADALQLNQLGYTMIEQYLNELGDVNTTRTYSATSGAISTAASWGGTAPIAVDNAKVTGTGAANGSASVSSGTFAVMKMDIGGNGPAAGEVVTVNGGTLRAYDMITVGSKNNATLNISSGLVETWNVQVGNTDFSSGSAVNYTGTVNLSGGTLLVSSIMRGVGVVGNWNTGGTINFSGGTIRAAGTLNINVPMVITGTTATIDLPTFIDGDTTNTFGTTTVTFNGTINGNMSGTGTLTKSGPGTLTLVGNNSAYSGPINLTGGAITLNSNASNSTTGIITLGNGTTVNIASNGAGTTTPIAVAASASGTLNGLGTYAYNGAVTGPSTSTLKITGTQTGTNHFSIGGNLTGFNGTLDFTNAANIRLTGTAAGSGASNAKWVMGTNSSLIRTQFGGTVAMGSLTGGATTSIQGATNDASVTTYSIGSLGTSTTFSGTITNGIAATPGLTNLTKVGAGTLTLNNAASTYTGVTTVSGGILAVTTLANGGVASSIGQSTNAAANLVLDGGTLKYTGAAVAINRAFTLGANGGSIDASGSGALDLNNTGAETIAGTGNRTLTLAGTNTGSNFLRGVIANPSSGQTSLSKIGAGTWQVTGANSYSGNTTVSAGSLVISGSYLPATPGDLITTGTGIANITGGQTKFAKVTATNLTIQNNGTLTVPANGTDTGVSDVTTLSILTGGKFDLTNNDLVVRTVGARNAIQNLVNSGQNGFDANGQTLWNGPGIISSTARTQNVGLAVDLYTLAVIRNGDLNDLNGGPGYAYTTWSGKTVGIEDVLVKYTYTGDTDLNGTITIDDYNAIDGTYLGLTSALGWVSGDFDLNGVITIDDYNAIDTGYLYQGGQLTQNLAAQRTAMFGAEYVTHLEQVAAGFASVPEPTSLALLGLGAAGLLSRRRKR